MHGDYDLLSHVTHYIFLFCITLHISCASTIVSHIIVTEQRYIVCYNNINTAQLESTLDFKTV